MQLSRFLCPGALPLPARNGPAGKSALGWFAVQLGPTAIPLVFRRSRPPGNSKRTANLATWDTKHQNHSCFSDGFHPHRKPTHGIRPLLHAPGLTTSTAIAIEKLAFALLRYLHRKPPAGTEGNRRAESHRKPTRPDRARRSAR